MNPTNTPAKFSGWLDTLINQGVQAGAQYIQSRQAGAGSGQAKGLAAITAASQQVLAGLAQLLQAAQQGADVQQVLSQAQQLAATLSNSAYFYQAKKGDDAAVLNNAKAQAAQIVQQIQSAYSGGGAGTGQGSGMTGGGLTVGGNPVSILAGDNTILYVGVGLVALLILTKKK